MKSNDSSSKRNVQNKNEIEPSRHDSIFGFVVVVFVQKSNSQEVLWFATLSQFDSIRWQIKSTLIETTKVTVVAVVATILHTIRRTSMYFQRRSKT